MLFGESVARYDFLADSEPSFDKARGVNGGVFLFRGEATSSVSLVSSNCEVNEPNDFPAKALGTGEVGLVDEVEEAGFERYAA